MTGVPVGAGSVPGTFVSAMTCATCGATTWASRKHVADPAAASSGSARDPGGPHCLRCRARAERVVGGEFGGPLPAGGSEFGLRGKLERIRPPAVAGGDVTARQADRVEPSAVRLVHLAQPGELSV